jgi:hypothetical protein
MSDTPVTDRLALQVLELAHTPFVLRDFRSRWTSYGWNYEPHPGSDEYGFHVSLPGDSMGLMIDPLGSEVVCAALRFYWWENFLPQSHADQRTFELQRAAYDRCFEATAELVEPLFPNPFLDWQDDDHDAHRAIGWETGKSVLLLQQACFDPGNAGLEINFWLSGAGRDNLAPRTALIDRLMEISQLRHAEHGFPPLVF